MKYLLPDQLLPFLLLLWEIAGVLLALKGFPAGGNLIHVVCFPLSYLSPPPENKQRHVVLIRDDIVLWGKKQLQLTTFSLSN